MYDGIDDSLDETERYWKMAKRRWICSACGKENLAHHASMKDGTDGREYRRVRFLEVGTPLCFDCIEPLDKVREDLERKILQLHPEWNPQPPWCFVCGQTGGHHDKQFVEGKGIAHTDCIRPRSL
jgi:ribosomal protein L32